MNLDSGYFTNSHNKYYYHIMKIDIVTQEDLMILQEELIKEINKLFEVKAVRQNKWLKTKEAQKILNCSIGTLQNLRLKNIVPFTKVGGAIYYLLDDIENLLKKNKTF